MQNTNETKEINTALNEEELKDVSGGSWRGSGAPYRYQCQICCTKYNMSRICCGQKTKDIGEQVPFQIVY